MKFYIKFFCIIVSAIFVLIGCEEEKTEVATPEKMIGKWYLIDRGPNLDSTITACEKREYLVFRDDFSAMRHQDCLPKSDTEGSWQIIDGKCMMLMKVVFQGRTISDSTEYIEFKLIEPTKIKVEKKYDLFTVWGIYQKQ